MGKNIWDIIVEIAAEIDKISPNISEVERQLNARQQVQSKYDNENEQIIEDMDDGDDLESVCDSDDEIQQQPPPKPRKTKYEGLKCMEFTN